MLYAQIPSAQSRDLATRLEVDLPLGTGDTPVEGIADDALLAKTKLVVQFLEEQGKVGTVDEPGAYFKGQLPLRWGPYNQLVCFSGAKVSLFNGTEIYNPLPNLIHQDAKMTTLGLGGSFKHVLGHERASFPSFGSAAGNITDVLFKDLENNSEQTMDDEGAKQRSQSMTPQMSQEMVAEGVETAWRVMSGPEENIEFVARKLFCFGNSSRQVLLGSPIYAALADA